MTSDRHHSARTRCVAIELAHSMFHAVICEGEHEVETIRTRSVLWRQHAGALNSATGLSDLTAALTEFAQQEDISTTPIHVVLSGEYCITRHVSGTDQTVRERLDELEARCARYLLLGHGRKVGARYIRVASDNTRHGLLTVANQRTLETLSTATKRAGLKIASISASVVLIAELVNHVFAPDTAGVVVRPREGGLDLAVVDDGQLLLDVRPAQNMNSDQVGNYVSERLSLLKRFFGRNAISENRNLERIYVCANRTEATQLTEQLADRELSVECLGERIVRMPWPVVGATDLQSCSGAFGATFGELPGTSTIERPDLLNVIQNSQDVPLKTTLARTLWPLAAAILLCVFLRGLTAREQAQVAANTDAVLESEAVEDQMWELRDQLETLNTEVAHLNRITEQTTDPAWSNMVTVIGGCLTDDASLLSMNIDQDSMLKMHGSCSSEQNVYQFVENVDRQPVFSKAALSGTRAAESDEAVSVEFDVEAEIRNVGILQLDQLLDEESEGTAPSSDQKTSQHATASTEEKQRV